MQKNPALPEPLLMCCLNHISGAMATFNVATMML
nr:MAG TPA: hypothetical protein [Caudoviricetes sp.]